MIRKLKKSDLPVLPKIPRHPDVSATKMYILSEKRLPLLNASPDFELKRFKRKVHKKFVIKRVKT